MQVLDYSFGRPSLQAIKDAGFAGIMRYLSYDSAKNLDAAELDTAKSLGLEVGIVWETTASRVKGGGAAGISDAQDALRQANALGITGPIYFAIDYDAPEGDQPAINAYFQACAGVIGTERLGCYSGYWPLKRLFDAGIITYGWQTLAWSGGNKESRAHLYQNGAQTLGADINDVLRDNWNGDEMGRTFTSPVNGDTRDAEGWYNAYAERDAQWNADEKSKTVVNPINGDARDAQGWFNAYTERNTQWEQDQANIAALTKKLDALQQPVPVQTTPPQAEDPTSPQTPQSGTVAGQPVSTSGPSDSSLNPSQDNSWAVLVKAFKAWIKSIFG